MGKYDMKQQKKSSNMTVWIIGIGVILVAAVIVVVGLLSSGAPVNNPGASTQPSQPAQSSQPTQSTQPSQSTEPVPSTTAPTQPIQTTLPEETSGSPVSPDGTIYLDRNLRITDIGKYVGMYMEDGTNEVVTNVMMIILHNDGTEDLQLARIVLEYSDFTAQFEATNLPAGEAVVLLEKNRLAFENSTCLRAELTNCAFFPAPMSMMEEMFEVTGGDGYIDIKNITADVISGEIFIYYKNSATDLLYGGITYRCRVSGGIAAGETVRIMAGHYQEGSSRLLMVSHSE